MKTLRYSDSQIMAILKQNEAGIPVPDLCREHGMSSASFYKWRVKFGGMDASLMKRMKELEDENRRLKKMLQNKNSLLKSLGISSKKSCKASSSSRAG
jgi:putative transposase